ncbi:MAG: PaaI family thioesterase [Bryobacteraceae bacterium]
MRKNERALAALRRLADCMPFNQHLGIRLLRVHPTGVTIECPLRPELMNSAGVLHGGVTATLADVAVGIALTNHLGRLSPATTVELKVNYLRPVAAGRIRARAHLLRVGARICCGRVDLFNDARELVAAALVTYMLSSKPGKRAV